MASRPTNSDFQSKLERAHRTSEAQAGQPQAAAHRGPVLPRRATDVLGTERSTAHLARFV